MKEKLVRVNGIQLNYVEGPANGRPLLLLHGGSGRWQAFANIIPELSAAYHLFALDLRGHGLSDRAAGHYTVADFAADVAAFIDARIEAPPLLFGHSLGGIVALMVGGQKSPELAALLVGDAPLTAATWLAHLESSRAGLIAWRDLAALPYDFEQLYEATQESLIEDPGGGRLVPMRQVYGDAHPVYDWIAGNLYYMDPDVLTILIDNPGRAAAGYEMSQLLPAISSPVLLLQADPAAGGLMRDAEVAAAMKLLAQPALVKLNGVSHVLHNEDKEAVMAAVGPFIQDLT